MTPTKVLLARNTSVVAQRVRDVLRGVADIDLRAEVTVDGDVLGAVKAHEPHLVVLDLDPPVSFTAALVTDLLTGTKTAMLALLAAHGEPTPEALTRGLAAGRLEIMRPPDPTTGDAANRWDRAFVDTMHALGHWLREVPVGKRPVPRRVAHMIGIAASTGGPPALAKILADLPADLPAPLLLAQHMTPGFVAGLVRWLSQISPVPVSLAADGVVPEPGRLYVAPDGCDIEIQSQRRLRVRPGRSLHCPSADTLFSSLAEELGADAGAIILTGMGRDGARGLLRISRAGGMTIAQDEASSVVFGMPKAAIEIGAASQVLPLGAIAAAIRELAGWRGRSRALTRAPVRADGESR